MGFPGVYGAMFPVVVFKAAWVISAMRETAVSVVDLLLGRGWESPSARDTMDSSPDWLHSEAEAELGVRFAMRDSLVEEITASLPAFKFPDTFVNRNEVQCSVCLNNIAAEEEVRQTHCSHVFHKDCLDRWLEYRQTTCPLCRSDLATEEVLRKHESVMQTDAEVFASWLSSVNSGTRGRGFRWHAYFHDLPSVLSGVH